MPNPRRKEGEMSKKNPRDKESGPSRRNAHLKQRDTAEGRRKFGLNCAPQIPERMNRQELEGQERERVSKMGRVKVRTQRLLTEES